MNELTMEVLEIDGKDFVLVATINQYNFFFEETNPKNICILKEVIEDGEECYVSLDNDAEVEEAYKLYYEHMKKNTLTELN